MFREGTRVGDSCFSVVSAAGAGHEPRLGLAISRRVARSAVARNRIKRVVRESFRRNRGRLPALDIVVLARQAATGTDNRALFESLERHWQRLETPER